MSYIDPSVTLLRLRDVPSGDSLAGVPSASCSDVSIVDQYGGLGMLEQVPILVDVGAHVGQYSLLASGLVGREGAVHSFEPEPATFALLQHNVLINGLRNVHPVRCALAESSKEVELYVARPDNIGQTSLRQPDNFSGVQVKVQCRTLDDYAEGHGLGRINLIKIDVEGAELDVLLGARWILSRNPKPHIIIEFWEKFLQAYGSSCAQVAEFLEGSGYSLFWIGETGLTPYLPMKNAELFNVLGVPRAVI